MNHHVMNPLFGWVPPDRRTLEQTKAHENAILEMPQFRIVGSRADGPSKVLISDCAKAVNGGKHFRTFYQQTGSCVGNGGGQAVWHLSAVQNVKLGLRIVPKLPFYLITYGRSRYYGGLYGRGEGSFGSAFAKAIKQDGILFADSPNVDPYQDAGGITWGSNAEMKWSDGGAISNTFLNESRKYLVKTTAQCRSADDVRAAIQNYYPCTCASDWGGQMRPGVKGSGENAVLLNTHADTWMHQMSVHGWWDHPSLGELFYILNSWGVDVHGTDPAGGQPGGFWITKKDMEYIVRQEEVFAFSQFDGFPAQELDRELFRIVGS